MALGVKFTRIYRIISKKKFPWNIISISKICISIIEYRIVTDNLLMKLSVIVSIAKSSLGHHWDSVLKKLSPLPKKYMELVHPSLIILLVRRTFN